MRGPFTKQTKISMAAGKYSPEKVKQLLSSFVRDDASTVNQTEDVTNPSSSSVRSRESFLARVRTYTPLSWFAKPAWLSPPNCARYGWENVMPDILQCVSCKAHISGHMPPPYLADVYQECCKKLENSLKVGHNICCSWASNPCPVSFLQIEMGLRNDELQKYVEAVTDLLPLGPKLPSVTEDMLEELHLNRDVLSKLSNLVKSQANEEDKELQDEEALMSASLLALCGWRKKANSRLDQASCQSCSRDLGLWNYISPEHPQPSDSEDSEDEDVMSGKDNEGQNNNGANPEGKGSESNAEVLESELSVTIDSDNGVAMVDKETQKDTATSQSEGIESTDEVMESEDTAVETTLDETSESCNNEELSTMDNETQSDDTLKGQDTVESTDDIMESEDTAKEIEVDEEPPRMVSDSDIFDTSQELGIDDAEAIVRQILNVIIGSVVGCDEKQYDSINSEDLTDLQSKNTDQVSAILDADLPSTAEIQEESTGTSFDNSDGTPMMTPMISRSPSPYIKDESTAGSETFETQSDEVSQESESNKEEDDTEINREDSELSKSEDVDTEVSKTEATAQLKTGSKEINVLEKIVENLKKEKEGSVPVEGNKMSEDESKVESKLEIGNVSFGSGDGDTSTLRNIVMDDSDVDGDVSENKECEDMEEGGEKTSSNIYTDAEESKCSDSIVTDKDDEELQETVKNNEEVEKTSPDIWTDAEKSECSDSITGDKDLSDLQETTDVTVTEKTEGTDENSTLESNDDFHEAKESEECIGMETDSPTKSDTDEQIAEELKDTDALDSSDKQLDANTKDTGDIDNVQSENYNEQMSQDKEDAECMDTTEGQEEEESTAVEESTEQSSSEAEDPVVVARNKRNLEMEDQDVEPKRKRIKKPRRVHFHPVSEHRPWCPWVVQATPINTIMIGSDSNQSASSSQESWRQLLDVLLPDLRSPVESFVMANKSTPPRESLRNIRRLLANWTSPQLAMETAN